MKEILKDEYITLTSTEHDFDIIAIIENNSEEIIRFETNGEDLFYIEPKSYIGLIASNVDRGIFEALRQKKYWRHIGGNDISYELEEDFIFNLWGIE